MPLANRTPSENPEAKDISKFVENRTAKTLRSQLSRFFAIVDTTDEKGSGKDKLVTADNLSDFRGKTDLLIASEYWLEGFSLKLKIRIFDVDSGRLAQELVYEGQADSTLDNLIDNVTQDIRTRISELDAVVIAQHRKLGNQIAVLAGTSLFSAPTVYSGSLQPGVTLQPSDFKGMIQLAFEYQFRHFLLQDSVLFVQPRFETGKRDISVQNNLKQISAQATGYSGVFGVGYIWHIGKAFYLTPLVGGGYYSGKILLNYDSLEATPFNSQTGEDERSKEINTTAWIGRGELRFGYRLGKNIALELSGGNTIFFYSDSKPMSFFILAGMAYAF